MIEPAVLVQRRDRAHGTAISTATVASRAILRYRDARGDLG
jgi:hypothetical protein